MGAMRHFIFVLLAPLAAASCASTYADVGTTTPYATIKFAKGYKSGSGFRTSAIQDYAFTKEGDCKKRTRAALFSPVSQKSKSRRVPAGRLLYVDAVTTYSRVTDVTNYGHGHSTNLKKVAECNARAMFQPIAGHTYIAIQAEQQFGECDFDIVDKATGAAPADLKLERGSACPMS